METIKIQEAPTRVTFWGLYQRPFDRESSCDTLHETADQRLDSTGCAAGVTSRGDLRGFMVQPLFLHIQGFPLLTKQVRRFIVPDLRVFGANERIRTADLRITSALLYQLSHVGLIGFLRSANLKYNGTTP